MEPSRMEWAANWSRRQWLLPRLQVLELSSDLPNSAESFSYMYIHIFRNSTLFDLSSD
jgi:hypothetical protein